MEAATVARLSPWDALALRGFEGGWDTKVTFATNGEWVSYALRAWHQPTGKRAIGLWRGRPGGVVKFTSACTWGGPGGQSRFFGPVSAAELKAVLSGE